MRKSSDKREKLSSGRLSWLNKSLLEKALHEACPALRSTPDNPPGSNDGIAAPHTSAATSPATSALDPDSVKQKYFLK